jgi:hypothetical protein
MLAFQTPSRPSDQAERNFIDGTKTVDVRRLLSPPMLIRKSQFRLHAREKTQVSPEEDDLMMTGLSPRSSFNVFLLGDVQRQFERHGSATSSSVPLFPPLLLLQDDPTIPESPSNDLSSQSSQHIRLRPRKRIRGCIAPLSSR